MSLGIFTGVIANALMVVAGAVVGCLFKTEKLKTIGESTFKIFALYVLVMGVEGAMGVSEPVKFLLFIIVGVAIGELIDLDNGFNRLGSWLQSKVIKGDSHGSTFAQGFVEASMLFCIGSMTFMGAFQSGLQNEHSIYLTKGVLDMIAGCTMAMGSGIGVAFSALTVLVYQGLLVVLANLLSPIMLPPVVTLCVQIGSLILIAIAFGMLKINKIRGCEIKPANALPAMFLPIIWETIILLVK